MEKFKDIISRFLKFNYPNIKYFLYTIIILDILISVSVNTSILLKMNVIPNPFLHLAIINLLTISVLVIIFNILILLKNNNKFKYILRSLSHEVETLHKQKHDFNNHLNVISGYLQLNKYDHALKYAFKVNERHYTLNSVSKIKDFEISSMLYNKLLHLQNKNISLEINSSTSLDCININSKHLSKAISLFIDFLVSRLENSNNKNLSLNINEFNGNYDISFTSSLFLNNITNLDSLIDNLEHKNTKKVKKLFNKYNSELKIKNDENNTTFSIIVPAV